MNIPFGISVEMVARLIPRYGEPHRRYHTWSHIGACFDAAEYLTPLPISQEIVLALLYHDAVYFPFAKDNEEQSAMLLVIEGRRAGLDVGLLKKSAAMILATEHASSPESEDACIVVDADLSILGTDEATFDRYENAIREEYKAVHDEAFAAGRRKVMQSFLDREWIFSTRIGRAIWEETARANIKRSVRKWSKR